MRSSRGPGGIAERAAHSLSHASRSKIIAPCALFSTRIFLRSRDEASTQLNKYGLVTESLYSSGITGSPLFLLKKVWSIGALVDHALKSMKPCSEMAHYRLWFHQATYPHDAELHADESADAQVAPISRHRSTRIWYSCCEQCDRALKANGTKISWKLSAMPSCWVLPTAYATGSPKFITTANLNYSNQWGRKEQPKAERVFVHDL